MTGGRPIRFLAMVSVGWVGLRVAILWQTTGSLPAAIRGAVPLPPVITAAAGSAGVPDRTGHRASVAERTAMTSTGTRAMPPARSFVTGRVVDPRRVALAFAAMTRFGAPIYPDDAAASAEEEDVPRRPAPMRPLEVRAASRLSFSSWAIARGGTGIGASPDAPQLGGSQGGVRVDYALGRGLAATGRLAAPAAGAGREASLGIAWRPAGVPLRFVAEQRVALDGGRGGPALGISGGVSELPLPAGFRLEGYAQGGAILRRGVERYVDGSARVARTLTDVGGITLDVGGGAWGGAQRGVARLDIGPSIGARLPIAGRTVRLAVDWRQRIAGGARPGSGPALSLGSDF